MSLREAVEELMDIPWPRTCAVETCNNTSDRASRHVCSHCFSSLPFFEAGGSCKVCGALIAAEYKHKFVCETCTERPPAYEFARSAMNYDEPVDTLIKEFKFRKATWLCEDLTDWLEGLVRAKFEAHAIDVVVPIPLHPNRERQRGYNQSALLAKALAKRMNRRADCKSLVRALDTEHQARLSGDKRLNNLKNAFKVVNPGLVRGRTVLLLDDVMTTGATLDHASKELISAGARRVWCATLARALMKTML